MPSKVTSPFQLVSEFEPQGDQPRAIERLLEGLAEGEPCQTLLGITGSGKTFTIANTIQRWGRPTLIIAPNKTLAAQLYGEMRNLFPNNAVRYFVSYYDYYQPEAYVPTTDTFIEKDAIINDQIDRMRHAATQALLSRDDVIIVASVSCIYGIGASESYMGLLIELTQGQQLSRDALLRGLVDIQYERNDVDFHRGTFRVRGDIVEIFPVYEEALAIRIEFFGDEIESITEVDPLRGRTLRKIERYSVFPGSHYVTPKDQMAGAITAIRDELRERLTQLNQEGRLLEHQRLEQRTNYDLEMLEQMGFCHGIENYSRHFSGRRAGDPPPTLVDYFPDDFLLIIDESHQTIPQLGAMYRGDRARKETLVEHGFRLPSALDNRPLRFEEFETHIKNAIYVSATPGDWEMKQAQGVFVEQVIRRAQATGVVVDPVAQERLDLLVPHDLGEHGAVGGAQHQPRHRQAGLGIVLAVDRLFEQGQPAVAVHRLRDVDQERLRDRVAAVGDQRMHDLLGVMACSAGVPQPQRRDAVGMDVLRGALELGERGNVAPRRLGVGVVDLQQESLVGLDDQWAIHRPVNGPGWSRHSRPSPRRVAG